MKTRAFPLSAALSLLSVAAHAQDETMSPCLDIVFVVDTRDATSMKDSARRACALLPEAVEEVCARGVAVRATYLGVLEPARLDDGAFSCLDGYVGASLGTAVPGEPRDTDRCGEELTDRGSWGPAAAIVAARFAWRDGATRMVVPVSESRSCAIFPGPNLDNVAAVCRAEKVVVVPLPGLDPGSGALRDMAELARATGGSQLDIESSSAEVAARVRALVAGRCRVAPDAVFRRGDVDASGNLNITDGILLFGHLFLGEPGAALCEDVLDPDDSGAVNLTDGIVILHHLFLGTKPPACPYLECGEDPTADTLACLEPACEGGTTSP